MREFQSEISMTVKGGTTPACAACKYQRRKCSPACPLAPYFPADQPKTFQNVHRLFGVSKVTRTLKDLDTKDQRDDAMQSIIYEADMRRRFPVNGCCAVIAQLRQQLQLAMEELHYVCANIDECRLSNIAGSSPGKDTAPPLHHGGGQFIFEKNGGQFIFEENSVENIDVPTVSWIQAQMNELGIHKNYVVPELDSSADDGLGIHKGIRKGIHKAIDEKMQRFIKYGAGG